MSTSTSCKFLGKKGHLLEETSNKLLLIEVEECFTSLVQQHRSTQHAKVIKDFFHQ